MNEQALPDPDDWEAMEEGEQEMQEYLAAHRFDLGNARYWYGQAQRPVASKPLAIEWDAMARELLDSE